MILQKVQGYTYIEIQSKDIFEKLPELLNVPFEITNVTLHWTAGRHDQPFKSYHINLGESYILVSKDIATRWHYHLPKSYKDIPDRNPGNLGLSFMGMLGATLKSMGSYPITPIMIETASQTIATIKKTYNLDWSNINDHAHWAEMDNYRSYRWDCAFKLESGKTVTEKTINKAKWYYEKYLK